MRGEAAFVYIIKNEVDSYRVTNSWCSSLCTFLCYRAFDVLFENLVCNPYRKNYITTTAFDDLFDLICHFSHYTSHGLTNKLLLFSSQILF